MNSLTASLLLITVIGTVGIVNGQSKPTCGGSTSSKNINFVKPTYEPRVCEYTIKAYSKLVCQVRIDFAMVLAQPTIQLVDGVSTAACETDYFEVNGLRLCGTEEWQHIYVPFNASDGESSISLTISTANRAGSTGLPTPEWDMTAIQLECPVGASVRQLEEQPDGIVQPEARATIKDGFFVAPPGCLQYFPQSNGVVKSFNFNYGDGIFPMKMNYAICFRRTLQTTALTLRVYSFNVRDATMESTGLRTDNSCHNPETANDLDGDYMMVSQATIDGTNQHPTYFCGDITRDVVIRSNNPGPLVVLFNNDATYSQGTEGFAFTYKVE